jgi:hypothetical protein
MHKIRDNWTQQTPTGGRFTRLGFHFGEREQRRGRHDCERSDGSEVQHDISRMSH